MIYQSLSREYCPAQADRFFGLMVLLNKEGRNEHFLDVQIAILLGVQTARSTTPPYKSRLRCFVFNGT
jgi:hypothetical protein